MDAAVTVRALLEKFLRIALGLQMRRFLAQLKRTLKSVHSRTSPNPLATSRALFGTAAGHLVGSHGPTIRTMLSAHQSTRTDTEFHQNVE